MHYNYVLSRIGEFAQYTHAVPLLNANTDTVARELLKCSSNIVTFLERYLAT